MNIVTQKAKKRQRIIEYSLKHGKSEASRKYKEPLSNIKRWSKRYDGTWQSLKDKSRRQGRGCGHIYFTPSRVQEYVRTPLSYEI